MAFHWAIAVRRRRRRSIHAGTIILDASRRFAHFGNCRERICQTLRVALSDAMENGEIV